MGLLDWRQEGSTEGDVRIILQAEGKTDRSLEACKEWARTFIRDVIPWWASGEPLTEQEAVEVGARFCAMLVWGKQHQYDHDS